MSPALAERAAQAAQAATFVANATTLALVLALVGAFALVVWLGRELLASRLSVRMLAENQRLSRREVQHKSQLQKERSRRWQGEPSDPVRKTEPPPAPVPLRPESVPPPLPPVSLGVEGVDIDSAPDWNDSRPLTELDLRLGPEDLDEPLPPTNLTEPIELVPDVRAKTAVWPHRKLPPIDK